MLILKQSLNIIMLIIGLFLTGCTTFFNKENIQSNQERPEEMYAKYMKYADSGEHPDSLYIWLQQASKLGLHEANAELGYLYLDGTHFDKDTIRGLKLLKESYKKGVNFAGMVLSDFYWKRNNIDTSLKYLEELANKGDEYAIYELANIYLSGIPNFLGSFDENLYHNELINVNKGVKFLNIAVEKEMHEAQIDLGFYYLKGTYSPTIPIDSVQAKKYFKLAWNNPTLIEEMGGRDNIEVIITEHVEPNWEEWLGETW